MDDGGEELVVRHVVDCAVQEGERLVVAVIAGQFRLHVCLPTHASVAYPSASVIYLAYLEVEPALQRVHTELRVERRADGRLEAAREGEVDELCPRRAIVQQIEEERWRVSGWAPEEAGLI